MGSSVDFEYSSPSYIDIGSPIDNASAFTIAVWAKFESLGSRVALGGCTPGLDVGLTTTSSSIFGINGSFVRFDDTISTGTWYHFAWSYDGTSTTASGCKLYLNGVQKTTINHFNNAVPGAVDTSTNTYRIGQRQHGGTTDVMDGLLAYNEMFTRELSIEEINEIMHKPGTITNGLDSYHPMIGPAANYVKDWTGNGYNGTSSNTNVSSDGPPVYFPNNVYSSS